MNKGLVYVDVMPDVRDEALALRMEQDQQSAKSKSPFRNIDDMSAITYAPVTFLFLPQLLQANQSINLKL